MKIDIATDKTPRMAGVRCILAFMLACSFSASAETLANGAWTGKTWHDGASYTYTEGTDPAAVRLTWHGAPDGVTLVIR